MSTNIVTDVLSHDQTENIVSWLNRAFRTRDAVNKLKGQMTHKDAKEFIVDAVSRVSLGSGGEVKPQKKK